MVSLNPAIKFLGIKDIGSNSNAPREKEILYKGCYETPTFKFAKETDWDKFIDFLKNKDSDDLINMGEKRFSE